MFPVNASNVGNTGENCEAIYCPFKPLILELQHLFINLRLPISIFLKIGIISSCDTFT